MPLTTRSTTIINTTTTVRIMPLAALLLLTAACSQHAVDGAVIDIQGDRLPGVAVTVSGTEYQAVSDARGEYKVRYMPGTPVELRFAKTGYTPGVLLVDEADSGRITARPVQLWMLPQQKGVYFFDNFRYEPTTPLEPEQYALALEEGFTTGVRRAPEVFTRNHDPRIFCFKLPQQDIRLNRLVPTQARHEGGKTDETFEVFARGDEIPIAPVVIDEPEGLLVQVQLGQPLEPGVYAVHLGALTGLVNPADTRIFCFRVLGPEEPESPVDPETEEKDETDTPAPAPGTPAPIAVPAPEDEVLIESETF